MRGDKKLFTTKNIKNTKELFPVPWRAELQLGQLEKFNKGCGYLNSIVGQAGACPSRITVALPPNIVSSATAEFTI